MANPTYGHYVLGLRDVKITKLDGSAQEDMDAAQEFSVTISVEESVLEGDDTEKASISRITGGEGNVGAGSLSLAAMAIIFGTTVSTAGSTPNRVSTLSIANTLRPPYFKVYGTAYDDNLGSLQVLVHKAKLSGDFEIPLASGDEWVPPGFDFRCLANDSGVIVDIKQLETAAELPSS